MVGLAGGPTKTSTCTSQFGYETALDYKTLADASDMEAALTAACPDGIDVYYDMVGGQTLDTVVPLLNVGARVVIVGSFIQGRIGTKP